MRPSSTVVAALVASTLLGTPVAWAGPGGPVTSAGPGIASRPTVPPPPINVAYPTLPWTQSGAAIRYLWQAAQPVIVDIAVIVPPAPVTPVMEPPAAPDKTELVAQTAEMPTAPQLGTLRQTFVVPGYYVAETPGGYHYPARWTLERVTADQYQWRLLPARFQPR
jgi:hypothetical protein